MTDIEKPVRQQIEKLEKILSDKRQTRDRLSAEIVSDTQELRRLTRMLRAYGAPSGRPPAAVSDEQVKAAVVDLVGDDRFKFVTARDVASKLGVEPRNVGRKLRKLVDVGEIHGTAESGYGPIWVNLST